MNAFDDNNNNNNDDNNSNSNNNNDPSENEQRIRKGKGRQKITMAKIQNDTNLQVTFSKRRAGVFKKASELSTLCGAQSAFVVFSPGNKPHSFGHPNVDTVANRFLSASSNDAPPMTGADQLILAHSEAAIQQRNQELIEMEAELERERQRKTELCNQRLPQQQLDSLSYQQLEQLKQSVLGFKRELEARAKNAAALPNYAPPLGNPNSAIAPTNAGGTSSAAPFDSSSRVGSYGYMVQYPPIGAGSSSDRAGNYVVDPSAMVPYEGGTGSSDGGRDDEGNQYQGFGGSYRRHDQF